MSAKTSEEDKFPCSVRGAIACSNYYSALQILEMYVVEKDELGICVFDRELFSLLQVTMKNFIQLMCFKKLYYKVNDVENTQGAYLHIINNSVPSASETILNSQIIGDITEALPMISSSEENRVSIE
jgi:hypothetical protein